MAYMNYKQGTGVRARADRMGSRRVAAATGTGVRARADLSANARPATEASERARARPALTDEQLVRIAEQLFARARAAREHGHDEVRLSVGAVEHLGEALLERVNRGGAT